MAQRKSGLFFLRLTVCFLLRRASYCTCTRRNQFFRKVGNTGNIIIIITSCYPLGDIRLQQNVAIWYYFCPSSLLRPSSFLFLTPHCGPIFSTSAWVSVSSFSLRVPIQGHYFDGFISFPPCMPYPNPFPSLDLYGHLSFLCPSPKFFISDHFRSVDIKNFS